MLPVYHMVRTNKNKNNMALRQNLMALIVVFLFFLTLASMGTAHAAVLGTSQPSSVNPPAAHTAPPTHDTFLDTRELVSVTKSPT